MKGLLSVNRIIAALAALLFAAVALPAAALPGQTLAQFNTWAKGNSALHGFKVQMSQDTALNQGLATFAAGSIQGDFTADFDQKNVVVHEMLSFHDERSNYDILKHPDDAQAMVKTVYGSAVAADLATAAKVGSWTLFMAHSPTTLYRGKLYGYELGVGAILLFPLSAVNAEAKRLPACVKDECNDD